MRLFLLSLLASTGMLACTDTKVSETEEICNDGIDDDQDGSLDCDDSDCASNIVCDADGDGFGAAADCDDNDPSRYPGATELCDNLDNDCNDIVDDIAEDSLEGTIYYADTDGDTFGDADASVNSCTIPEGYVTNSFDCDDSSDAINPDAEEVCDNLDNNCDNEIDNNPTDPLSFYMDMDGDGFGDAAELQEACAAPEGYVENQDDCDDANDTVYPGADEICDDLDNNCDNIIDENPINGSTYYIDTDNDGHGSTATTQVACAVPTGFSDLSDDCDDTNDTVYLDAFEICDGIDNDCDTLVDDADDTLLQASASNWYQDNDNDGYGNTSEKVEQCVAPAGYVEASGDCNDTDPDVSPAALEVCDSIDNDCDGVINNKAVDGTYFYRDVDGDGYGSNAVMVACSAPTGFVANSDDCNDADASINPVAAEVCDDVDQNCSGDENDSSDAFMWYFDADGDGYGDPNMSMSSCTQPEGYVADNTDCDDTSADAFPDMSNPEVCDGVDNNCDGNIDAADSALDTSTYTTFYTDADGDGFGVDDGNSVIACLPSAGLANNTDDCDDSSADSNPDADEICNGVDNDCDGIIDNNAVDGTVYYLDLDGDGFGDPTTEELYCANNIPTGAVTDATDCDDSTDLINTNGTETCADGLDNNCDGNIDCDDSVCAASPQCGEISCTDGLDDDSDGFIDCLDSECVGTWQCTELCTDQKDNDADGLYDCEDDDCATNSNCFESDCNDFGDNDGNGLVDCEDPTCASSASCGEISCTDGVDNDGDGGTDCDDSECGAEPTCQSYCVSDDLGSAVGEGVYTGVMTSSTGTDTMLGSCNLTTGGVDVSMTWTPPQDGCYQFDTESSFTSSTSTTNTDTVLYVREGSCSGAEIGCSEDEGAGFSSIFIAEAFSDTEYVITIDGYSSFSSGNLVLDIEFLGDHCPEAICYDGLDDDNDGAVDCADQDCAGIGDCLETDCADGADDEGDGLIDCADPDCEGIGSCVESDCADDIDNEGDGLTDCEDPECEGQAGCVELNCADLVDDDEDGLLDCDDPDCEGQVGCVELNCADLVDDDNDGLLDCDDPDCEGQVGCVELNCADGLDDDLDGDVDCADSECAEDAYCETFCHDYDLGSDLGAAVYTGDTTTGADTLSPSADCSSSTGGLDSSYTWTPPSVGTYTFSVSGAAFDPILSIKTDCLGEELDCYDDAADTTGASLSMDITSTDPLTIVVDSADGGSGLFTLGIVADFEADCNDGVDNEGDGLIDCDDSDCGYQFECASPSCPNFDLESISGEGVAFGNNTNPAAVDSFQNPVNGIIGCGSTSSSSPDYSYSWLAPADGCVVFDTSESTYDTVLRIMDDCNGSVLDCDDDGSVSTRSELAYPVEEGESYIIIVDGYSSSSTGDYQLDVAFTAGVDCSGAEFDCGDGTDNDGDGDIDCDDSDCASQQICNESSCTDGVDNELDGLIDCADDDCASDPACYESDCTDGVDNDTGAADGLIDCLDPDCAMDVACYEYSCNDLADDDNDGLTDCDDPDCFGEDACIELDCFDSIDDDNDGLIDCLDDDCIDEAGCLDYCVGTGNDLGDVTGFSVATGLNGGSGDSFTPSCSISESGGEEVILSWEAPQTGHYRFSTEASDYDTVIYLLESCVGGELADACNDDVDFINGTYTSMVEGDFVAGETVTIVIDGYDANALGTYVLDIIPDFETDCSDGIDNEGDGLIDCDDSDCDLSAECACPIEDLGTQTGDGLIEATLEDALFDQFQASCTTQGGEDMTYTWEAPTTGCATVDTLSGTMDSILVAFTDCPGSGGTEIACNDDYSLSGGIYESEISFDVVAGTSYVIGVDSWSYAVADPYILDINIQANVSCP
jgi:hypothetical protein